MAKVFVIDDSVSVCVAIERMLSEQGHDVVWEKDPATSLSTVEKYRPDLVICDLVLPEISGFELCDSLASNPLLSDVPVLMISGRVDDDTQQKVAASEAVGILVKPFSADSLIETVEAILSADSAREETGSMPDWVAEWSAFAALGCRHGVVLGQKDTVLASFGDGDEDGSVKTRLQRLATSCMTSLGQEGGFAPTTATLETEDGVMVAIRLSPDLRLTFELPDARRLGQARFVLGRLRSRLEAN